MRISSIFLVREAQVLLYSRLDEHAGAEAEAAIKSVAADGSLESLAPVFEVQGLDFCKVADVDGLVFVAALGETANVLAALEALKALAATLRRYFGAASVDALRNKLPNVLEVVCECVLSGVPQELEDSKIILSRPQKQAPEKKYTKGGASLAFGKKAQDIFVDVNEVVSVDADGLGVSKTVELSGRVLCDARLRKLPLCTLAFEEGVLRKLAGCAFDSAVDVDSWALRGDVAFRPERRVFEVMRYRLAEDARVDLPVRVSARRTWWAVAKRMRLEVRVEALFRRNLAADSFTCAVPVPRSAASVKVSKKGDDKAAYEPHHRRVAWKISRFSGACSFQLDVEVSFAEAQADGTADRRPVEVEVLIPSLSASGAKVRYLNVQGAAGTVSKWVRHLTHAKYSVSFEDVVLP
ncbi:Adaptor complexes medium subunit family-domain-containing protein [Pelagophyceae sp. CCMP2097]|nr:Adaptor complexes medium subunit family-domain-containing protein [Pelagophyceae sp. CCMP2097]